MTETTSIDDAVVIAQYAELRKRIPSLYVILIVNTFLLCMTQLPVAPTVLTVYAPGALILIMLFRLVHWIRARQTAVDAALARRSIQQMRWITNGLGILTISWAVAMFGYGSNSEPGYLNGQGHAVLFVGLTVLSVVFLMMHEPKASLTVALIVVPPFCLFLLLRASFVETAVSVNLAAVTAAMVFVVSSFGRDFRQMVEMRQANEAVSAENARLANIDPVTELANRRAFFSRLDAAFTSGRSFAVVTVDLDGFKQVNDHHGHAFGDKVLSEVARRVAGIAGAYQPARLGGDEFGIVVTDEHCAEIAPRLADSLIRSLRTPINLAGIRTGIGASIGIGASDRSDTSSEASFERSDYALYDAKRSGRNRFETFGEKHALELGESGRVERSLRGADIDAEFDVVYQPIVHAQSSRIVAFEALVRWNSPECGFVSPAAFIPVAEKIGSITQITRFVLNRALRDIEDWESDISLKVNLSPIDLMSPDHVGELCAMLEASGIDPSRITFELTETSLAKNFEEVQPSIKKLRALGCGIALDDFGIEYSSLRYVQRLSPNVIKIDKSFVDLVEADVSSRSIIRTIVELARNVGAISVAEGVETHAQAVLLRALRCDEMQGYLFSKPVSRDRAVELMRAERVEPGAKAADPHAPRPAPERSREAA